MRNFFFAAPAKFISCVCVGCIVLGVAANASANPSVGRAGGGGMGGGRPAMSGGGRPAGGGGGGMSRPASRPAPRPSTPSMQRPSVSHPSVSRPSGSRPPMNVSRPNPGPSTRPNTPSLGGMTPSTRPAARPPVVGDTRPGGGGGISSLKPPGELKPVTRPGTGGIGGGVPTTRPTPLPGDIGKPGGGKPGGQLPGITKPDRPTTLPGITKPDRPTTLPGITKPDRPTTLPGDIGKPGGKPGGELPGIVKPDRPTTLPARPGPGDRPIVGGRPPERPTTLPGIVDRPGVGGRPPVTRPEFPHGPGDRPIVGGRPNRPVPPTHPDWGWGNNNWANRPGWNNGWNNGWHNGWHNGWPGGWNNSWHNHWHDHWYGNHVHWGYHGWYHGCWTNVNWYAPLAYGVTGWGFTSLYGWGLGTPYYNPYYVPTVSYGYDYSQPIVVNNYVSADDGNAVGGGAVGAAPPLNAAPSASPPTDPTVKLVDDARQFIYDQKYRQALGQLETASRRSPGDPVVHELRALCYFAMGEYDKAAASLNSLLASAPGMDWTTMSALYADSDDYTRQLRRLESHCKSNPTDAAAAFVLAYQYLVLGETDPAINALRAVVKNQPRDAVAKRMLESLSPSEPKETPAPPKAESPLDDDSADAGPQTDLVGTWTAKGGETPISLAIDEEFGFTWKAQPPGKDAIEIRGKVETTNDTLVLDAKDSGTMAGQVISNGPDRFEFRLLGTPDTEAGLVFTRRK